MAWCHQATSHYLSQCWPRSLSPYDVDRPQWFNSLAPGRFEWNFENNNFQINSTSTDASSRMGNKISGALAWKQMLAQLKILLALIMLMGRRASVSLTVLCNPKRNCHHVNVSGPHWHFFGSWNGLMLPGKKPLLYGAVWHKSFNSMWPVYVTSITA